MRTKESSESAASADDQDRTQRLLRYYRRAAIFLVLTGLVKGAIGIYLQWGGQAAWWIDLAQLATCALTALWVAAPYRRRARKALGRIFEIVP